MKRFTDAGRAAIQSDNLYAALSLALIIPDICGSLEDPGPGKSTRRYIAWYHRWVLPKFTKQLGPWITQTFITGNECYQLRCSLIHSGSVEMDPGVDTIVDKFLFFDNETGSHLNLIRIDDVNVLQLRADRFSAELFDAADEWDIAVAGDERVQAEKKKLLTIRPRGYAHKGVIFR